MIRKPTLLLFIVLITLLLSASPVGADREGWNEPPRAPGYDSHGLLKINFDYFNMAAATGGDFYFWAPGEFASSAGFLTVPIASDPIALAYGSGGKDFTLREEIPIDTTISRLSLFAGAQRLDELRLLRPDGRSVEANAAGVVRQVYKHMRIVTVEDPEPGRWQVEARGAGNYSIAARYLVERKELTARDLEAIDLIDFDFVEVKGRPGHEGLFPVTQTVRAGERRLCRITLTGGVRVQVIDMISASEEVLGEIRLDASADETAADEFIGTCRVPAQPFRVRVRGEDREGNPFQRLTGGLTSPEKP